MRRPSLIVAVAALSLIVLAGCDSAGGGSDASSSASASSSSSKPATSDSLEASGGFGDKPEISFPDTDPPTELAVDVLVQGDGPTVGKGDLITVNYLGQVWQGDVFDNSYDRGAPTSFGIGVKEVIAGWDEGLVGQTVGSRVLLTVPADKGYGDTGQGSIPGGATLVFVVDIVDDTPATAVGDADATPEVDPTTLGFAVDGAPGSPVTAITVQDGTAEPTEVQTAVLYRASGEPVQAGSVIIQFAQQGWDNASFWSSWAEGAPMAASVVENGQALSGLVGVPVGSRVLIQIPANAAQDIPSFVLVVDVIKQDVVS